MDHRNKTYNASIWARSSFDNMSLSITTGSWRGSALIKGFEYYTCGGSLRNVSAYPDGACAPGENVLVQRTLSRDWQQLTALR